VVPGASHIMHEDNASALNEMVLRFLGGGGEVRSQAGLNT
jgi:hypothetical protein